jgi:ubiquinol-cytochrome c reductase cytochrome c subunit
MTGWKLAGALVTAFVGITVVWRTPASSADASSTRALYQRDCADCHGADGRGTDRGPTLEGVGRASVDYYLSTGRMPLTEVGRSDAPGTPIRPLPAVNRGDPDRTPRRHRPAYPKATVEALVTYVTDLAAHGGPDIPSVGPGQIADGGQLFRLNCAACHAWAGDGGALLHREAPALHSATATQIAEAVRVGPGQMPAFGSAALTDAQLASVVTYVRYLDHPDDRGGRPLLHLGPVAEGAVALMALACLIGVTLWIGSRG